MDRTRQHRRAVLTMSPHYKFYCRDTKCYYCGDPASTIDHCPALSVAYAYGADYFTGRNIKFWKVPACRQCNAILGNKPLNHLHQRVRHIYDRLQSKYEKYMKMTEWHPEEIAELNGWLREYVQTQSDFQQYMERRFQYMEDLHYDII